MKLINWFTLEIWTFLFHFISKKWVVVRLQYQLVSFCFVFFLILSFLYTDSSVHNWFSAPSSISITTLFSTFLICGWYKLQIPLLSQYTLDIFVCVYLCVWIYHRACALLFLVWDLLYLQNNVKKLFIYLFNWLEIPFFFCCKFLSS